MRKQAEAKQEQPGKGPPDHILKPPSISLPKGGGAIKGIDEKFSVNSANGTASVSIPVFVSPGRAGFQPSLSVAYNSGSGNSVFGLGWSLSIPSITRKTSKGLPRYRDEEDSDTFILAGAEDLVPKLTKTNSEWVRDVLQAQEGAATFSIRRYRPRIEGLYARIERWQDNLTGEVHWRSTSKENITSLFGTTAQSRIADPADETRVFEWLIAETRDDCGNIVRYEYKREDSASVDASLPQEKNRLASPTGFANRYLKRVFYGNRTKTPSQERDWCFVAVMDYGDHDPLKPQVTESHSWPTRQDAFSDCHPGFELRTYRLCRRILMFHQFDELGPDPYLVRSTDFSYDPTPAATFSVASPRPDMCAMPVEDTRPKPSRRSNTPIRSESLTIKSGR